MNTTIASRIASLLLAIKNCERPGLLNPAAQDMQERALKRIMEEAPSGSGFDHGTSLNREKCNDNQIVFVTGFHHIDENGFYDGWTWHDVYVRANLVFGLKITITGGNRNHIKDYVHEVFHSWLSKKVDINYGYQSEIQTPNER